MLFNGEYYYHLDAKNRLVIPGRIRDLVDVTKEGAGWYLVPGYEGTISLYTPKSFEGLAGGQRAELFRIKDIRDYDRLHFALSAYVEMDRLGRILIPEVMLKRSGIGRDVAILGVRDHVELWDKPRWETFLEEKLASYDEMARKALESAREDERGR